MVRADRTPSTPTPEVATGLRCGNVSTSGLPSLWCSADTRCPSCIPGAVSTPWLALVQPHTTLRLLGNGDGRRGTLRSWRKVVVGDPGARARLLGGGCRQRRACRGHLQAAREHARQDHPLRTQVRASCHALKCRAHVLFHLTGLWHAVMQRATCGPHPQEADRAEREEGQRFAGEHQACRSRPCG